MIHSDCFLSGCLSSLMIFVQVLAYSRAVLRDFGIKYENMR